MFPQKRSCYLGNDFVLTSHFWNANDLLPQIDTKRREYFVPKKCFMVITDKHGPTSITLFIYLQCFNITRFKCNSLGYIGSKMPNVLFSLLLFLFLSTKKSSSVWLELRYRLQTRRQASDLKVQSPDLSRQRLSHDGGCVQNNASVRTYLTYLGGGLLLV